MSSSDVVTFVAIIWVEAGLFNFIACVQSDANHHQLTRGDVGFAFFMGIAGLCGIGAGLAATADGRFKSFWAKPVRLFGQSAASDVFPLGDKPLWAKCVKCEHYWPVAYLPMDVKTLGKVAKGGFKCPRCGDNKPVVARQASGMLTEGGDAKQAPGDSLSSPALEDGAPK